ncbi:hypothetical protein KOR42_03140 [Thalassoglobus neptunius]|uniref:Uncharacterized protein n=1 Tax=Thalassoglobus neptunius TaxID=1938619 RepID=A0A5C5X2A2_9PLAN|nr:hypothetical protein [Thalassoglobus neptunius]TWT56958.1 hypothetical protein KOR42_03140 [Thalassoglobus neptunius]
MKKTARSRFFIAFLCSFVALASPGFSQEESPDEVAGDSPEVLADETAADEIAPVEVLSESGERIIYIPFKDFESAFGNPDSNVILPFSEYEKMMAAWKASQQKTESPDAVLSQIGYTVTIDGEIARVRADLRVNVLKDGWVELPVQFGAAAVGRVAGDDVLLRGVGNGQYALLFQTPGEKNVSIDLAVRVKQSPDGQEISFQTPPVAVTTLDVTVPREGQAIEVTPQIVEVAGGGDEAADGTTRMQVNVGATNSIRIQWHPEASLQPEMNLLASVENQTLVTIEDGLIHTDAYLKYEILRGTMEGGRVVVPASHRILDVTASSRIKNWQVVEQDGEQIVDVEFLSAIGKGLNLELHTERKLDAADFNIAGWKEGQPAEGIHAMDVVRESGQIAVRHASDISLTVLEQQGVVRIEPSAVDEKLAGSNALTYKFYSPDFSLTVNAKPVEPRLIVGHRMVLTFQDDELEVSNSLNYSVERMGVFELKLRLPEKLQIDDVISPRLKEFNVTEEGRLLTVTLLERTLGEFPVEIRSHRDLTDSGDGETLPLIEPLGVERETGTIQVFARPAIEVITETDQLEGVQPVPTSTEVKNGVRLNSAWSFTRRPAVIPVRTERKPTRLSAFVGTTISVQDELTQVRTQLDYLVEYSGLNTFRFEVPEAISDSIQIETAGGDQQSSPIQQRTSGDPVDGWVPWTIITQRDVIGLQRFIISYDIDQPEAEEEEADSESDSESSAELTTTIQLTRPLGLIDSDGEPTTTLTQSQGEVVIDKERSLSIAASGTGGGLEQIDLRELTRLPQSGTLAFRYFRSDADDRPSVEVSQSRHEIQEVVSTIVPRGLVEIVTGEDFEGTYRCRYLVKTTERQRLLVYLPVDLEVLGTFLNEREVSLEIADVPASDSVGENLTPFWVNVARTDSSDEDFLLTFQFLWKLHPALGESAFGRGEMLLPLPVIGRGDSAVVQELKVAIWVPEKYALVGDPEDFHLQTRHRAGDVLIGETADRQVGGLENWVSDGHTCPVSVAQFPTDGRVPYVYSNLGGAKSVTVRWWNQVVMTLIVSLAVGVIGWLLLKTSWENKLGMLLIALFAAALYGISDSHALSQGLYAARFGMMLLIGLWIINWIFQLIRGVQSTFATAGASATTASPINTDSSGSSPPTAERQDTN